MEIHPISIEIMMRFAACTTSSAVSAAALTPKVAIRASRIMVVDSGIASSRSMRPLIDIPAPTSVCAAPHLASRGLSAACSQTFERGTREVDEQILKDATD